ncbi:hypothetical protein HNR61_001113 [Actinomadura namibiensis]|uniref:Uncharacterized protein n=1 Tax=Actinomadura namibiensis TaxID=182080 RepID=A0A7W3LK25_ACTNM|nr:hypothetical protein [Actinomadura namibiensis]
MTLSIAAPPRGWPRRWDAGSSLVAHTIARKLPIFTLPSPDQAAP